MLFVKISSTKKKDLKKLDEKKLPIFCKSYKVVNIEIKIYTCLFELNIID